MNMDQKSHDDDNNEEGLPPPTLQEVTLKVSPPQEDENATHKHGTTVSNVRRGHDGVLLAGSDDLFLEKLVAARQSEDEADTDARAVVETQQAHSETNSQPTTADGEKQGCRRGDPENNTAGEAIIDTLISNTLETTNVHRVASAQGSATEVMDDIYTKLSNTAAVVNSLEEGRPGAFACAPTPGLAAEEHHRQRPVEESSMDPEEGVPRQGVRSVDQNYSSPDAPGLVVANPVHDNGDGDMDDNLPHATRISTVDRQKQKQQSQHVMGRLAFVLYILLVAGGIVLAMVLQSRTKQQPSTSKEAEEANTTTLTMAPTTVESYRREYLMSLLPDFAVQNLLHESTMSPQSLAMNWTIHDPWFDEYDAERLIQRYALALFYHATGGPRWTNQQHWMDYHQHECRWYMEDDILGDFIENATEYIAVTHPSICEQDPDFEIDRNNETIKHLWLYRNNLVGSIPDEIALLPFLRSLSVHSNVLQGSIPTRISQLSIFESLYISNNEITGVVPSELGLLTDYFYSLSAINCKLRGPLPSELGQMSWLYDLLIDQNEITGTIPTEWSGMSSLVWLYLSENLLTGTLPSQLAQNPSLEELLFSYNSLTGTIPTEYGQWAHLYWVEFNQNKLKGQMPSELGSLTGANYVLVNDNMLSGTLPSQLGQLESLYELHASDNSFTGSIPEELALLEGLEILLLQNNSLTGSIPAGLELGAANNLSQVSFANNPMLSGTIPIGLCVIESLEFDCDGDRLCGCDCACSASSGGAAAESNETATTNATASLVIQPGLI